MDAKLFWCYVLVGFVASVVCGGGFRLGATMMAELLHVFKMHDTRVSSTVIVNNHAKTPAFVNSILYGGTALEGLDDKVKG